MLNNEHSHLNRRKIIDKIHTLRAWVWSLIYTPVKPQKCAHEFKMRGYNVYRSGKTKLCATTHVCTLCGLKKNTTHKY
jgi:hypothetical protein